MKDQRNQTGRFAKLFLAAMFLLSCSSITIAVDADHPTAGPGTPGQQIGFDFASRTPAFPKGDEAAALHLFVHPYPVPANGFITGVVYLNDADTNSDPFDLLVLRPDHQGWKVVDRLSLSDDQPPARTGTTVLTLPTPISVQENDIFAHWQSEAEGAIPLNGDDTSIDGLSMGQYQFHSADVEIGQHIRNEGFTGKRDYFINITFTATP